MYIYMCASMRINVLYFPPSLTPLVEIVLNLLLYKDHFANNRICISYRLVVYIGYNICMHIYFKALI